jgi:DNA-binding MarR family transcriptional regulator
VARRPDPADRRSRLVVATDDGRATWGRLQDELRRVEAHVLSPLPAADAASFQTLLGQLACRAQRLDPLADLCEVARQVKEDEAEPPRVTAG